MMDLRIPIAEGPVSRNCNRSDRLSRMCRRLGVGAREAEIRRCLDLVCGESLAPDAGWSSLNADGVPVQFALNLAPAHMPPFEFVGEAFRAGMGFRERRAFGLERMTRVASVIGLEADLASVRPLLAELTEAGQAGDGEDPAGAFWIGASFDSAGASSMTVYANGRRGPEPARWTRLEHFVQFVADGEWARIFAVAQEAGLRPLGAGVRLAAWSRPHARVYFGAYGISPREYRRMFHDAGGPAHFDGALGMLFDHILGADVEFPTQSAVFSFGANGDGEWSPKLELCAHCLSNESQSRIGAWGWAGVPVYIGVGMRHGQRYLSLYLNPGREGL